MTDRGRDFFGIFFVLANIFFLEFLTRIDFDSDE